MVRASLAFQSAWHVHFCVVDVEHGNRALHFVNLVNDYVAVTVTAALQFDASQLRKAIDPFPFVINLG